MGAIGLLLLFYRNTINQHAAKSRNLFVFFFYLYSSSDGNLVIYPNWYGVSWVHKREGPTNYDDNCPMPMTIG